MKSSKNHSNGAAALFKHVKYEHLVAGITGGVTSTLLLHPLDLLKIRFAGKFEYEISINILGNVKKFWPCCCVSESVGSIGNVGPSA